MVRVPRQGLAAGQVRVRNIYIAMDPTQRLWLSDRRQYLRPVSISAAVRATVVGEVIESRDERFAPGDLVHVWMGGWETESVVPASGVRAIVPDERIPLTAWLTVLGGTGLTAWFGVDVGAVSGGDTLVVTAAASGVGSIVGQLAKRRGARVIGIAGGMQKCLRLRDEYGFDGAIDYRQDDVGAALGELCPDGVDVQFENVGGPVMDAVFARLARHGRVVICGLISEYNNEGDYRGPREFEQILMKRLHVRGLLLSDHVHDFEPALRNLRELVVAGALRWHDHVERGIDRAPDAHALVFTGAADGKVLLQVGAEPRPGNSAGMLVKHGRGE